MTTEAHPNKRSPATVMAGIPEINASLYHQIRFCVGDPAAWIALTFEDGTVESVLIVRDIEMDRARQHARVDRVACPADYTPPDGLSGDRETATAQAVAECLRQHGLRQGAMSYVVADRSLPLIFAEMIRRAGMSVAYDPELGVRERRSKDAQEIEWLREAQQVTETAIRMACELIAGADARTDGALTVGGELLTAERVRAAIDHWLLDRAFASRPAIVAGGGEGGDCHNLGAGQLLTGQPVIVDIFPRSQANRYNGDCTRTVVHGDIPDELLDMHAAVKEAKVASIAAVRAGVTGETVHLATVDVLTRRGYATNRPGEGASASLATMPHGTGHGIGIDVHEPPLLDYKGPALIAGDALTVEPGLYRESFGGVRVEDMVIVTQEGCENLNRLHEGLDWK